jgi:FAD/FMN-containing dehydrogenase
MYVNELSDALIDVTVEHFARVTSPRSLIVIQDKGGEMARGPSDRTAFGHRDARHLFVVMPAWEDPAEDDLHVEWGRSLAEAIAPFGAGGEYVNDLGVEAEEGHAWIRAAFGANYERLARIKAKYDPDNFFHHNQNIRPQP